MEKILQTVIIITFWDFLFYEIFFPSQVKRWEIISYKHGIYIVVSSVVERLKAFVCMYVYTQKCVVSENITFSGKALLILLLPSLFFPKSQHFSAKMTPLLKLGILNLARMFLIKCYWMLLSYSLYHTAQKANFFIKDFFSKCDQIHRIYRFLRSWSHLLKKSFMENFLFWQCNFWVIKGKSTGTKGGRVGVEVEGGLHTHTHTHSHTRTHARMHTQRLRLIKLKKAKESSTDSHFHNILRFFDVLLSFLFTACETMRDYYL